MARGTDLLAWRLSHLGEDAIDVTQMLVVAIKDASIVDKELVPSVHPPPPCRLYAKSKSQPYTRPAPSLKKPGTHLGIWVIPCE